MPVSYEIDRARGLIRTRCAGRVGVSEVLDHFTTLQNDPDFRPDLDVLLDLALLESPPAIEQLRLVAERIAWRSSLRFGILAILVDTDVVFGIARMFGSLAEAHFRQISVFRDRALAEQWLTEERTPNQSL